MQNDIKQELGINFIEYAVAVNTDRAIPDAKSGLKPVAKRILWSAFEEGRVFSKPHVKSAKIVGDVMGNYHPHGDSSIYGAMVRLSQNWVMRYPLIDWHGSNGNIAGDGPAAARYTEARLAKISEDGLLQGIKKRNVDFIPNYSEDMEEPVTLPSVFPNLLCNPNTGIGVAMACNWLPHNLREVAAAINDYMDGKEPSLPGPDFPTGGLIINEKDAKNFARAGHGSVKLRGKYKIEKNKIVFYEIPYGQNTETLLNQIGELADSKEIDGITAVRDESNKKGLRLVIECGKANNPESIVLKLFQKTNLQTSISYNQVALIDKTPTELNLKDCCDIYINHNLECITKEAEFDLKKALARRHIVEGLLKALEDIDNIIQLIKKSESAAAAKTKLIEKYSFSEEQAKAILAMRLSSLANLEKVELQNEKANLDEVIEQLNMLITDDDLKKNALREKLSTLVKKYGDERLTELANIEVPKEDKDIAQVIPEDVVVVATKSGLIKKVPMAAFKTQRRGGKGVKSVDDVLLDVIKTNTVDTMMFFTTKGKMYRTVVDNIPDGNNTTKGAAINNLIKLENDEKVVAVTSLHRKSTPKYIFFITKQGMIKKSNLEEYTKTNRNTGIAALKLKEGDEVVDIIFQDDEDLIFITKKGMNIRFATKDIGALGRAAVGIKGIKLNDGDEVVAALPVHKDTDYLLLVSEDGMGKRVPMSEFTLQGRGGKGTICYKDKTVAGAAMVDEQDIVLVSGNYSSICIEAKTVATGSKSAQGVIIIKNNRVLSVVKI